MARILIVEDEARIAVVRRQGPARRGPRRPSCGTGERAGRGAVRRVRPDGARHRAAGHRRLRRARRAALAGQPDAGDRADRPRLGHRHGLGARGRRRRLHAQAVPVRRAAGPGAAAAAQAEQAANGGGDRDDILEAGGVFLDLRTRQATVAGTEVDLSAREFALAEIFLLQPRPGAQPRAAARPRLGLRLRPGLQRRRRLRRLPAPQARRRRDQHRARHGLPLQPA